MNAVRSILFDLDGTLLDTAPDMAFALNQQRHQHGLAPLPLSIIRPHIGYGTKALLALGFQIDETHADYPCMLEGFLDLYEIYLTASTQLFPEMEHVLKYLDDHHLPWGIVTNKPARFTHQILKTLKLDSRASSIVSGDTLPTRKPHPAPLLYACNQMKQSPEHCLFVGDASLDVIASKSAGIRSLVALYGYIKHDEDPFSWLADGYIEKPGDIISWLKEA